jgi:hypothetical protein
VIFAAWIIYTYIQYFVTKILSVFPITCSKFWHYRYFALINLILSGKNKILPQTCQGLE